MGQAEGPQGQSYAIPTDGNSISELKDAIEMNADIEIVPTIIGVIIAAVVGVACIKLLQWILKKDMWKYFGIYCLVIGITSVFCSILGL